MICRRHLTSVPRFDGRRSLQAFHFSLAVPSKDPVNGPRRLTRRRTALCDSIGKAWPMLSIEPDLLAAKHVNAKVRYYSVNDYHELYRSGKTTPLDVVKALLPLTKPGKDNKHKYDDAWADNHGNDELVLEAARASAERWAAGKPLSILDGVPIGVKDDVDVKGYVNHIGMKYNADSTSFKRQDKSVWCVQALQDAGAVVLGRNRMHELGSGW